MKKRMDRYSNQSGNIPTRSEKNKNLYAKIYDGYDELENLTIPSNEKSINLQDLKKELTSRSEYHNYKDYHEIVNENNNQVVRKEKVHEQQREENEIYDIKELLNKAVVENKKENEYEPTLTNEKYLKKLQLDNSKTNMEQVKAIYNEIQEEAQEEDETLIKTASLSLDILSDLKSDNDKTKVTPPIKKEEMPDNDSFDDFYSNNYKFSKKDFEDKNAEDNLDLQDDLEKDSDNKNFFLKIMLLIFGISLVLIIIVYLFNYFNRVSG